MFFKLGFENRLAARLTKEAAPKWMKMVRGGIKKAPPNLEGYIGQSGALSEEALSRLASSMDVSPEELVEMAWGSQKRPDP